MIVALVVNQLLSSGTHLFAKATVTAIGPLATALLRFICASITLLLFELLRPRRERVARADIAKLIWLGFLVVPVNQGLFLFGLSQSTPSHAAFLYALTPLVVFLLARRFLSEGDARAKLIGAVLNRVDLKHNSYYYSQYYRREYSDYYQKGVAT